MGILEGRVACITGGTRGIGRGIAEAFLAEGASVVVNGRDPAKGQAAVDELDAGDRVHFIAGDVKQREDCDAIDRRHGRALRPDRHPRQQRRWRRQQRAGRRADRRGDGSDALDWNFWQHVLGDAPGAAAT